MSLHLQIPSPSAVQGRAIKAQYHILLELQESPWELTLGKGPCVPLGCRSQGFVQLSQAWQRGPAALSQRFPLQQAQSGSRAEGEGLRQLCGLQFSSSQAPDLCREAGEAGITAGWSCSTSRGNGNKPRVDYIPLETLRKETKKEEREKENKRVKKKKKAGNERKRKPQIMSVGCFLISSAPNTMLMSVRDILCVGRLLDRILSACG